MAGIRRLGGTVGWLMVLALVGCGDDSPTSPEAPDLETIEYASSLNVNISTMTKTSRGLYYRDEFVGDGETAAFDSGIQFEYQGWLSDGAAVDGGLYPAGPQSPGVIQGLDGDYYYALGSGQTIPGWDEGIQGMKVGGTRKVVIPPNLAFGGLGSQDGRVPPNAVLVYTFRLTAVAP